ncbi:hypothetical protein XU18_2449 [Perkinsela sp. CCAP 1560/4]|nr:hypothetical protein XU18_2449 [Perkinsela sp. CCAP 1560/4]|eukprot:KNH06741.1 hypothetical protein XU18_2449 [Perkinsela sp. CCAP 1560/4]
MQEPMGKTWDDSTLCRFTSHYLPPYTIVRQKQMWQLLQFIYECCPLCFPQEDSNKRRIMHIAAFPGSGKTMLLQQLTSQICPANGKTPKSISRGRGASANRTPSESLKEAPRLCPHARVRMISCASKSWADLLNQITADIEETNKLGKKSKSSKKPKADLNSRFVEAVRSFHGVLILDEIDTLVSQLLKTSSVPQEMSPLSTIGSKRRKLTSQSQCPPDPLGFLFETFHTSCPHGGLVLISNHMNIHAQNFIQSSLGEKYVQRMILAAYSKDELFQIITSRCGPDKVFEPPALTLLVSSSSDARRVLSVALESMLRARRVYRKANESVEKVKGSASYPLVTVADVAHCSSDSGDVMLRQLRTILKPLTNDLQLLLVGIMYLSTKQLTESGNRFSAITISSLHDWVFTEGLDIIKMQDIFDDNMFRKCLNSLRDFNFIKFNWGDFTHSTNAQHKKASPFRQCGTLIALQYDANSLKIAIQGLLGLGKLGREAFQATLHLLDRQ